MKPDITITIHFRTGIKLEGHNCWGLCQQADNVFQISVDKNASLMGKLGIIYHEITHALIGWAFGQGIIPKKSEESACNAVEEAGKLHLDMAIRGKSGRRL